MLCDGEVGNHLGIPLLKVQDTEGFAQTMSQGYKCFSWIRGEIENSLFEPGCAAKRKPELCQEGLIVFGEPVATGIRARSDDHGA
jgi:hypothetical protein